MSYDSLQNKHIAEKEVEGKNGYLMLILTILGFLLGLAGIVLGSIWPNALGIIAIVLGSLLIIVCSICWGGLKAVAP